MAPETREDQLRHIFNRRVGLDMKERRELHGVSLRALAAEMKTGGVANLCNLENGKANWTTRMQARVYAALERLGA